jgi:hypothetical protein
MPRIIVQADAIERGSTVTLLETVLPSQLESEHFSIQLVERLRWAIDDAAQVESSAMPAA